MYWPIGAPRIYAACNGNASKDRIHQFDDEAEAQHTGDADSYINASYSTPNAGEDEDGLLATGHLTPTTPHTPAIQPVEHHTQQRLSVQREISRHTSENDTAIRRAEKQPILSLRMSRTGQLFAVITETSMTIWQTKVDMLGPPEYGNQELIICIANCHISDCHPVQHLAEQLRPECCAPDTTRLGYIRRANRVGLPHNILLGHRSGCARIQTSLSRELECTYA